VTAIDEPINVQAGKNGSPGMSVGRGLESCGRVRWVGSYLFGGST
jgi:hypothetical protein